MRNSAKFFEDMFHTVSKITFLFPLKRPFPNTSLSHGMFAKLAVIPFWFPHFNCDPYQRLTLPSACRSVLPCRPGLHSTHHQTQTWARNPSCRNRERQEETPISVCQRTVPFSSRATPPPCKNISITCTRNTLCPIFTFSFPIDLSEKWLTHPSLRMIINHTPWTIIYPRDQIHIKKNQYSSLQLYFFITLLGSISNIRTGSWRQDSDIICCSNVSLA